MTDIASAPGALAADPDDSTAGIVAGSGEAPAAPPSPVVASATLRRTVHFQPPVNLSYPARADLFVATVVAEHADGTVDLVAHDGYDTPYEHVPILKSRVTAPDTGNWAVEAS